MARIYVPAVQCPSCRYPNDHLFRFCQMCGYHRRQEVYAPNPVPPFDLPSIDSRLQQLQAFLHSSAYGKQKTSLESVLKSFLFSLSPQKTLFSAVPLDVCRFLVWKDSTGKTQIHIPGCPNLGQHGLWPCGCPSRLAYKTVDSLIGKLRSIFKEAGRSGEWDTALGLGNPAASPAVKQYLKSFTAEQLQASITPKQASPLFLNKLLLLSRHIQRQIERPDNSPLVSFTYARDAAFFKTLFFSGDRANDLTLVKTQDILRFPRDDGFLFNHVWGKTLRDGSSNLFGIRRHPNPSLCPVKAIETYMAVSSEIGLHLSHGFLFRPTTPHGSVLDKQLAGSTMQSRLRLYLREANIDEGETLHSFRAGAAITLALSGAQLADIMSHVGWQNPQTAAYYIKLAQVMHPEGPSRLLAADEPAVAASASVYSDLNTLKNFVAAFPSSSSD